MTYDDLKQEYRLTNDGDDWGTATFWLFNIADEIYFERDFDVPHEWQFRPSPLGKCSDDNYIEYSITEAGDGDLLRFGKLLHRYTNMIADKAY